MQITSEIEPDGPICGRVGEDNLQGPLWLWEKGPFYSKSWPLFWTIQGCCPLALSLVYGVSGHQGQDGGIFQCPTSELLHPGLKAGTPPRQCRQVAISAKRGMPEDLTLSEQKP